MTKPYPQIAQETMRILTHYAWPGNVRELENCIEYAVLLCTGTLLLPEHLPQSLGANLTNVMSIQNNTTLKTRIRQIETALILEVLNKKTGNVCAVAREIGITPRMVRYKLKKLGIDPVRFRNAKNRLHRSRTKPLIDTL